MTSSTLIVHQARLLANLGVAALSSALDFIARQHGHRNFAALQAHLPETERQAADPSRVVLEPADGGYRVSSGLYTANLSYGLSREQVFAHLAWITGACAFTAAKTSRTEIVAKEFAALEDHGRPFVTHRAYFELLGSEHQCPTGRQRPGDCEYHRRSAQFYREPHRHDIRLWQYAGDNRASIGASVVHHSPTGWSWGYAGSGPADLALNIANAFVPPMHDGLTPEFFRRTGHVASRLAVVAHQTIKEQMLVRLPEHGGKLGAEAILTLLRDSAFEHIVSRGAEAIRCSDDISLLCWSPPSDWIDGLRSGGSKASRIT